MHHRVVLGFDFGLKRIGVAVGQCVTNSASPLTILTAHDGVPQWSQIAELIEEWGVDGCVVGLPINMDKTEQPLTQRARQFGEQLTDHFDLPVYFVDERLTTIAAKAQMHAVYKGKMRFKKPDSISAKLIVESWMQSSLEE